MTTGSGPADPAASQPDHLALPTRAPRPRRTRIVAIAVAVTLPLAWAIWYVTTPGDLPTNDREVYAEVAAGTAAFVGMFAAPADFGRTVHISSVEVTGEASEGASYDTRPLLCRAGAVGVTSEPERFCDDLVEPTGEDLVAGDSILVEVIAPTPVRITLERIEISFREGLSWGSKGAGVERATITVVGPRRDEGTGST